MSREVRLQQDRTLRLLSRMMILQRLLVVIGLFVCSSVAHANWEPFELDYGHIRIPSSIAGVEGYSIIDTGAQMNGVNSMFLKANNLKFKRRPEKARIQGVFGQEERVIYRKIPVTLYGVETEFRRVVDLDLRDEDWQLLLGSPFANEFIMQFDYPNKRMRLLPRKALNLKKLKNVTSRPDPSGASPIVRVKLDGQPMWLTLDTGNAGGMVIHRSIARREGWLDKYQTIDSRARGVIKDGDMETFNIGHIEIGPYRLDSPVVSINAEGTKAKMLESRTSVKQSRGILGHDVLKHFVLTIDYVSGAVHIAPPSAAVD